MAEESNNPTAPAVSSWNYAEGVVGSGDRPSYLKDKFTSVEAQAQSYGDLEKRFGGFTGSPENYEFSEGVNSKDPRINGLVDIARESNMSNDLLNKIIKLDTSSNEARVKEYREEQLKALGDNAESRLNNLNDWSKNNIPAELQDTFKSMATNAKAVELLESIMNNSKVPSPTDGISVTTGITKEQLNELQFAEDKHGNRLVSVDPKKREELNAMYARYQAQS